MDEHQNDGGQKLSRSFKSLRDAVTQPEVAAYIDKCIEFGTDVPERDREDVRQNLILKLLNSKVSPDWHNNWQGFFWTAVRNYWIDMGRKSDRQLSIDEEPRPKQLPEESGWEFDRRRREWEARRVSVSTFTDVVTSDDGPDLNIEVLLDPVELTYSFEYLLSNLHISPLARHLTRLRGVKFEQAIDSLLAGKTLLDDDSRLAPLRADAHDFLMCDPEPIIDVAFTSHLRSKRDAERWLVVMREYRDGHPTKSYSELMRTLRDTEHKCSDKTIAKIVREWDSKYVDFLHRTKEAFKQMSGQQRACWLHEVVSLYASSLITEIEHEIQNARRLLWSSKAPGVAL